MSSQSLHRKLAPGWQTYVLCPVFCVLFLFFVPTPSLSASDGWAATYGGDGDDYASSILQTSDGGYIVAGTTASFGDGRHDVWVLKLRPDGTVEWQKTYGGIDNDSAYSIHETSDGGYVVAGWTQSFGAGGRTAWVLKLRAYGSVRWQRTYGESGLDGARSIQQTRDGGYVVVGFTPYFNEGGNDIWVLKLGPDGTVEWQKTYGGVDNDSAYSIHETSDGGYIVAGTTSSFGAGRDDFWVLKLGADGTVEWQKTYGGERNDWAEAIHETRDGGYVVVGFTPSFKKRGDEDIWVLKLRPDGSVEWQKTYGGSLPEVASSIQQTQDGGYIVAGWISFLDDKELRDVWVLKLGPDGSVEWQKAYGGGGDEGARSIHQTSDGGYVVAGEADSFCAGTKDTPDLLVMKLNPDGSIVPSCDFVRDTDVTGKDINATVKTTSIIPGDSNTHPQTSQARVWETNISPNFVSLQLR